jgi:hypothetical protein
MVMHELFLLHNTAVMAQTQRVCADGIVCQMQ